MGIEVGVTTSVAIPTSDNVSGGGVTIFTRFSIANVIDDKSCVELVDSVSEDESDDV